MEKEPSFKAPFKKFVNEMSKARKPSAPILL
jgi:hypothetical protein